MPLEREIQVGLIHTILEYEDGKIFIELSDSSDIIEDEWTIKEFKTWLKQLLLFDEKL